MKLNEVIYYNQFSGLCEYFADRDLIYSEELTIGREKYSTDYVASFLLSDKSFSFPYVIEFSNYPAEVEIRLLKNTNALLNFVILENVNINGVDTSTKIGYIKIINASEEPIVIKENDGKGAVVIYNVSELKGSQEANHALGMLAVGLGTYFLIVKDGKWNK